MNKVSGTVIAPNGKILLYSIQHFIDDIGRGSCCFVCGAKYGSKEFNNEHVLPNWLLRKYNLHDKLINLSNGTTFKYGKYTIPCCKECNQALGDILEIPVCEWLKQPYKVITEQILQDNNKLFLLFQWLGLIFFKTHLKDKTLNVNLDLRKGNEKIADLYDWEEMHHLHCIVRSHYTGAQISSKVIGSVLILRAIENTYFESFDFADNKAAQTIMLRLNEFCIIAVLNDSCGSLNLFWEDFQKIDGALTPLQLREVFAHITYLNLHLKERPIYSSKFRYLPTIKSIEYKIDAKLPEKVELSSEADRIITFGEILYANLKDIIENEHTPTELVEQVKKGEYTFLFDQNGKFRNYEE